MHYYIVKTLIEFEHFIKFGHPYHVFHSNFVGDDVYCVAAVSDDAVDPGIGVVTQRFTHQTDSIHGKRGGTQGVAAVLGTGGMTAYPVKGQAFIDRSVMIAVPEAFGKVIHVSYIHIIQHAFEHQLGLAGDGLNFAFLHEFFTVIQLNTFFCRSSDKHHFAAQIIFYRQYGYGCTDQTGAADIVPAGVDRTGVFVALRVVGYEQ